MTDDKAFSFELAEPPTVARGGKPVPERVRAAMQFGIQHLGKWFIYDRVPSSELGLNASAKMANRMGTLRNHATAAGYKVSCRTAVDGADVVGYAMLFKKEPRTDSPTEELDKSTGSHLSAVPAPQAGDE
jgi:hypothetical protein